MFQIRVVKSIALFSVLIGFMVLLGWFLDIVVLTSILPQWIRMKVATAICFIFSGIVIYFLSFEKERKSEVKTIALTVFPMFIVLIMGTLFLGSVFGFQTGVENIAFVDIHEMKTPIFQGRPSVATMIAFLLIAFIGFFSNFTDLSKKTFLAIGLIVGMIGSVGALGYILGIPALYYEIPKLSNAIAIHTTTLFAFLGLAIYMIGNQQKQ